MRFDFQNQTQRPGLSGGERLRLWLLVACLGLVLITMRKLQQPETAERLGQVFGASSARQAERRGKDSAVFVSTDGGQLAPQPASGDLERKLRSPATSTTADADIKDNTYLRPQEREAWFETFAGIEGDTPEELRAASQGEIAYAQFIDLPDYYRHKVVTMRGTLLREELKRPGANRLGIETYHRLWIRPTGGGQWLFVVFCRELPADFPRGDGLREDVEVDGVFFKNWSYGYEGGLGLAPIVLANNLSWNRRPTTVPVAQLPVQELVWASTAAGVLALVVVWWVVRNTGRRRRHVGKLPGTFIEPASQTVSETTGGSEQ